tara:strand:- start:405 stop:1016 length:612 start_codon:yes stop_codon:yes gene_type:complete
MTQINLHGILAQEYQPSFFFKIDNPRDVLKAIDCNRRGFIKRLIDLQREGFIYDIIIDKKRIIKGQEMDCLKNPVRIDIIPTICGTGAVLTSAFFKAVAGAVISAAISYALTPKQDTPALEVSAQASKGSLLFSNTVNVANQGAPLPLGYGRLKVGSQVVQATIKSFPQHQKVDNVMVQGRVGSNPSTSILSSEVPEADIPEQ